LKNSADPAIQAVYKRVEERHANDKTRTWRATREFAAIDSQVSLSLRFPRAEGHRGLGAGVFNANPSFKERRGRALEIAAQHQEEKHMAHVHGLAQQSVWLKWRESAIPLDLSWRNQIYGAVGPHLLKFVLNASINEVRTPDMLKKLGYKQSAVCDLCSHEQCTLHHILVNCPVALTTGRYTWRHDSVLKKLSSVLAPFVAKWNAKAGPSPSVPPIANSFVRAGATPTVPSFLSKLSPSRSSLLSGAHDWQMLVDFDHERMVFPPEIFPTDKRPDVVLWSPKSRRVLLFELTCPAEEGIEAAAARKSARYLELQQQVEAAGWSCSVWPFEVGARGFVARSTHRLLRELGFLPGETRQVCRALATIVARCSFTIYLAASSAKWQGPALLC